MFTGFPEETIRFFLDLRFHNDVSFFKAHEAEYLEYVKKPFTDFTLALAPYAEKLAPDIELRPSKCVARIRRDTRFTKDKSPFRDHLWLLLRRSCEPRDTSAMFWFELSPSTVEWGLGFWGDNRPAMDVLRRRLTDNPDGFSRALKASGMPRDGWQIEGDPYKRIKVPPSVPLPLQAFYAMKTLYFKRVDLSVRAAYSADLADRMGEDVLALKPLYTYLRGVADEAIAQLEQ